MPWSVFVSRSQYHTVPAGMDSIFHSSTFAGTEMPLFRSDLNTGHIGSFRPFWRKYRIPAKKYVPDRNKTKSYKIIFKYKN